MTAAMVRLPATGSGQPWAARLRREPHPRHSGGCPSAHNTAGLAATHHSKPGRPPTVDLRNRESVRRGDKPRGGRDAKAEGANRRIWRELLSCSWDPSYLERQRLVSRWLNDLVPFPGEAYRQFVKDLVQANKLVRGEFLIDGNAG
jgi:hypothetical protein